MLRTLSLTVLCCCVPQVGHAESVPLNQSAEYWQYQSRYLEQASVDVLVSGVDGGHLERTLNEVAALADQQVTIRRVVVVGGNSFAQLNAGASGRSDDRALWLRVSSDFKRQGKRTTPEEVASVQNRLGLTPTLGNTARAMGLLAVQPVPRIQKLLESRKITQSPTWIVSYKGKRYLYRGVKSLLPLFGGGRFFGGRERPTGQLVRSTQPLHAARAVEYVLKSRRPPPGAGTYDVKPRCQASQLREVPVLYDSDHLSAFDLLYFDPQAEEQRARAEQSLARAIPYLAGDLYNPYRRTSDLLQEYARFFDVRCLPTRVRFFYRNGRRYEEYREGERAWDTP